MDVKPHIRRVIERLANAELVFTPQNGAPVTFKGIFLSRHTEVELGQLGFSTAGTEVVAMIEDLPGLERNDIITVDGVQYKVRDPAANPTAGFVRILVGEAGA